MLRDTDNMEAIRHDLCVGKEAPDQIAVGTAQIDTHHFDSMPTFETAKKWKEILDGFTRRDIEDTVFSQITEGGGETLLFMECVFIDPEHSRAIEGDAFLGFELGMLGVNARDGGGSYLGNAAHVGTRNALMVKRVKLLAKGFGAVSARKNTGQWFHKGTLACATGKASAMNP